MGDRTLEELPGWSLAWSDEFDGATGSPVDPTSWQPQVGGHGWGNQELQYYTDSSDNAALDGAGNLAITVRRTDPQLRDRRFGGCPYTSARLVTKDRVSCTYGLVEARIRLPQGRGIWPAFWMLGQHLDQVGWPDCGEIDVMENFGKDPTVIHGTVHGPGYAGPPVSPSSIRPIPAWPTTSTCTRSTGNRTHPLVPGRPSLQHRDPPGDLQGRPWVFDHDFFLLLNVAVGGTFSVTPDPSTAFPQAMPVDYIRIYATAPDGRF